jgi:hypothetical protein
MTVCKGPPDPKLAPATFLGPGHGNTAVISPDEIVWHQHCLNSARRGCCDG